MFQRNNKMLNNAVRITNILECNAWEEFTLENRNDFLVAVNERLKVR
jgi:hypothetical protein